MKNIENGQLGQEVFDLEEAAKLAWKRTIDFFNERLRG